MTHIRFVPWPSFFRWGFLLPPYWTSFQDIGSNRYCLTPKIETFPFFSSCFWPYSEFFYFSFHQHHYVQVCNDMSPHKLFPLRHKIFEIYMSCIHPSVCSKHLDHFPNLFFSQQLKLFKDLKHFTLFVDKINPIFYSKLINKRHKVVVTSQWLHFKEAIHILKYYFKLLFISYWYF